MPKICIDCGYEVIDYTRCDECSRPVCDECKNTEHDIALCKKCAPNYVPEE